MTRFRDFLLFSALMSLISAGALAQADTQAGTQADSRSGWSSDGSKEDKAPALNLGIGAAVLGWGFANWDYGSGGPRFQDEVGILIRTRQSSEAPCPPWEWPA